MASVADRIKDRILRRTNAGRITRNRSVQKQTSQQLQISHNRQNPTKKGTVGDDEDEDEDEDEDGSGDDNDKDGGRPSSKKLVALRRCDFCMRDPIGKQMCKQRYCDYTKGWKGNFVECSNCADHRSQNPGSGHRCKPPQINIVWRKYGVADPVDYRPPTCDQCLNSKMINQCNVDSTLGYGCTITKACRDGKCTINGQEMEVRPNPRVDVARWIRAECHVCQHKTKKGTATAGCSWLRDRSTWDQACSYCQIYNLTCLSGGRVVANPQRLTLPRTWAVNLQVFDKGFINCRKIDPARRYCKRCCEDDHDHCRADASSYFYSCNRCTQLGVDCIDAEDDTSYPVFDLARVGIGSFMPFVECECCRKAGRNCDLQRPCDSCVKHGDECDDWIGDTAKHCIKGRLDPPPGPLYYLALGYGAGGVDDPKDGSAIEHWVGPASNIYGIPENQNRNFIATMGVQLRSMLRPPGAPPHGDAAQGGRVSGRASDITREQIVAWIKDRWPRAVAMNQLGHHRERVEAVRQKMQDIRDGKIVSALFSDFRHHGSDEEADDGDEENGDDANSVCIRHDAEQSRVINAHGNSSDATATDAAPLMFDTSAPDWLAEFINSDMIGDGVASPPFECLALPGQNQFDFDAAAPASQMPANLQSSPFEVSHIDPSLLLVDIDEDLDSSMQIDSLLEAPSALEDIDIEFVDHNPPSIAQEEAMAMPQLKSTTPALYSFALDRPTQTDPPFYNVFGLISEDVEPFEQGGDGAWTCSEVGNGSGCHNLVTLDSACQCLSHGHDLRHVCNGCRKESAQELHNHLINAPQILAMRAYLCGDCTAQVSHSVVEVSRRRIVGAANIWGDCSSSYYTKTELELETPLGRIDFRGEARPITGCSCASKLFAQRLCRSHRHQFGNLLVAQVARMREWCVQTFGRNVCPGCLVDKPPGEANLSMDPARVASDTSPLTWAWACLACGDWVVNQKHPGLVPGWEQWYPPRVDN